jgi:hypothetical protein
MNYENIAVNGRLLDTNLIYSNPKFKIAEKALHRAFNNIELPLKFGVTHQAKDDGVLSALGLDMVGEVTKLSYNNGKILINEITVHNEDVYRELYNGNIGNVSANIRILDYKEGNADEILIIKELEIMSLDLVHSGACPLCRIDINGIGNANVASEPVGLDNTATLYKKIELNEKLIIPKEENIMVEETKQVEAPVQVTLAKAEEIKLQAQSEIETRDKLVKELEAKVAAQATKNEMLATKLTEAQEAFIQLEQKLDTDLNDKLKESIIVAQREAKAEYIKELDAVAVVDKAISEGKIKPSGRELFISLSKNMGDEFEVLLKNIDPAIDFTRLSKHVSPDVITDIIKEGHEQQISLSADKDLTEKMFAEMYPESKIGGA